MTITTGLYPTWLDFFKHNPSVDDLNENSSTVVRVASQNPTGSVTDRFADASLFTDCCALAVSALPGHLWFVHHWQRIGNPILHPNAIKYVAINGIADYSELTIVNPASTFAIYDITCPSLSKLLGITSDAELLAPVPLAAADREQSTLSGFMFLPPYILDDISSIHRSDITSIYSQARDSIQRKAAENAPANETPAETTAKLEKAKPVLQWLWAAANNLIPSTPTQVSLGIVEQGWKTTIHNRHIFSRILPSGVLPVGTTTSPSGGLLPVNNDQLSSSLAKIAVHFEKNSLESAKKDQQSNPSWSRISAQSQSTILRAMSTNSINAAEKPTSEYEEFLQQRTAAMGFQFVLEYFESNERSRYVAINQGMVSALWTGVLRSNSHGTPQNLSPFFVPRRSADGQTAPNLIGQHLRQTEGQGLDFSEIKLATKQKISLPTDLLSFTHQMKNFHLLLRFLFGENSILYLRIQTVVDHIQRFEAEYDDRFQSNHEFFAEILSIIDRRVQSFLENCSNTSDVSRVDFTVLGFDTILRSITDGTFVATLPAPLRQAMPRTVTPPTDWRPNLPRSKT